MQQRQTALPPRNLIEILNETFEIFGKHVWQFMLLVIVLEGPIVLAFQVWGDFPTIFNNEGVLEVNPADLTRVLILTFLWLFSLSLVFGAVTIAVAQHYLSGQINIKVCYTRLWWRVITMTLVAAVFPIAFFLLSAAMVLIVPAIVLFVVLVYWSMSIPSVVVQGLSGRDALARSYNLVRGNWWRTLGIIIVSLLVGFGFGILVTIPFILVSSIPALGDNAIFGIVIEIAANFISLGAVPAILFIIATLLYLDLRVRKEDYDMDTLAREMGVATA